MSSPSYLVICCCKSRDTCSALEKAVLSEKPVDITSLVSAVISLISVVYLFLPRPDSDLRNTLSTSQTRILAGNNVRKIIHILVFCDVLAVLGIIARSWVRLSVTAPLGFCIFINIWIQFFFLCTYSWNIVYGVELLFSLKNVEYCYIKYLIGFIPPLLLSCIQIFMLYYSPVNWCLNGEYQKIVVYLAAVLPIVMVMLINPVIYNKILKSVRQLLIQNLGRFGVGERQVLDAARFKFTLILLVFFLCWLPNMMFAFLQLFEDEETLHDIFIAVAVIQAIMNSLQACLNCMVYRGWPGALTSCSNTSINMSNREELEGSIEVQINALSTSCYSSETDPILNFRNQRVSQYS